MKKYSIISNGKILMERRTVRSTLYNAQCFSIDLGKTVFIYNNVERKLVAKVNGERVWIK